MSHETKGEEIGLWPWTRTFDLDPCDLETFLVGARLIECSKKVSSKEDHYHSTVIVCVSVIWAGIQLFSPLAEFSPLETKIDHSWDQCESDEKIIFRWGRGGQMWHIFKNVSFTFGGLLRNKIPKRPQFQSWQPVNHIGVLEVAQNPLGACATCRKCVFSPYRPSTVGPLMGPYVDNLTGAVDLADTVNQLLIFLLYHAERL